MVILAIDVGGTFIKSGVVLDGKALKRKKVVSFKDYYKREREDFLEQLCLVVDFFVSEFDGIESINLCMPGPFVDKEKGVLGKLKNLPLEDFNILEFLSDKYGLRVVLENDANCFALGEYFYGGYGVKSLVGITLGTGFGVGIVFDDKIFSGDGNAGELSGLRYKSSVIENYVNSAALIRYAKKEGFEISDTQTGTNFSKK